MAFLGLVRKKYLQVFATELGLSVSDNFKISKLRDLITSSENYKKEFLKNLLSSIADERKMAEQAAEKCSLQTEITQLIAREDEEDSQDYRKVKEILLKRYREDDHEKTSSTPKRRTIKCHGCGTPGYIKSKCPNCSKSKLEAKASVNSDNLFTFEAPASPSSLIVLKICGVESAVCADTCASHSISGEKLFYMLQSKKVKYKHKTLSLTLADGIQNNVAALTTVVDLKVEGKVVPTELIVLPKAKGSRTLLGTDFLQSAGIVLDIFNGKWNFWENPQIRKRSVETSSSVIKVPEASSFVNLRSEEGTHLTKEQRTQINFLLQEFKSCFEPGGEVTTFSEHRITNGNSPPVAKPPYRKNPAKRELLKKELDSLLAGGIIEECESPYASPVVLVPKPNCSMRLCVDFRKLNSTTIADTYPLPRVEDLLTEAKSTTYMSTIDLKSGYHQGPEQQEAFENVKKSLITPDGSKPFRIHTDASSYALGDALTQREGPEEHVIEYASRLLIPAERNYLTAEREALAVVWALEKFRGYDENQEIIIASDHHPLKWFMSIMSTSGRLARWDLQIQSFNPKIEYTLGKANVLADMLSRPTNLNEDVPCDIFAVTADVPVRKCKDIRQEQWKDEELKKIIELF
ncbi:Retrovirus-related Pol polyprotein from transposon 297 [Araneus ventricosus]|uniref:Retrovirus-related Pol polyprotein from transposon 297 n=1 Tax=Araneus ventricosus TaxID=182803 RepID=A0A4Y2CYP5_ARAVE|nr:Retrovirus-related Pol polyprotein from transposon 297 [Araneus ventricosus]